MPLRCFFAAIGVALSAKANTMRHATLKSPSWRDPQYMRGRLTVDSEGGTLTVTETVLNAAANSSRKNIAIVLRGESFRAQFKTPFEGERAQVGHHKRRTCEDNSFEEQQHLASDLMQTVKKLEARGFAIDLFGATYECQNGLEYSSKSLQDMYEGKMRKLDILSKADSTQLSTMAHAMHIALQDGTDYDAFYLIRWDNSYAFLQHFENEDCFFEEWPRDRKYFEVGNKDSLIYVPGVLAEQFVSFMERGVSPDGCCMARWSSCPVVCNDCATNFGRTLGKGGGDQPRLSKSPCASQARGKSPVRSLSQYKPPVDTDDDECIKQHYPDQPETKPSGVFLLQDAEGLLVITTLIVSVSCFVYLLQGALQEPKVTKSTMAPTVDNDKPSTPKGSKQ